MKKNGNRGNPHATAQEQRAGVGLAKEGRAQCIQRLNVLLADETVLYIKTKNYHWNVTGVHFYNLHALFEKQYEELDLFIDEIAERVRALGGDTVATLREYAETSRLEEQPGTVPESREMVRTLLRDHESVIRSLRADVEDCSEQHHDEGTANFLTDLMFKHEKIAWMLRSILEEDR